MIGLTRRTRQSSRSRREQPSLEDLTPLQIGDEIPAAHVKEQGVKGVPPEENRSTVEEDRDHAKTTMERLDKWYSDQCDEDWEHSYGIDIRTSDNPGWSVYIDIKDTYIEDMNISDYKSGDDYEKNWIAYKLDDGKFRGSCGAGRLDELLNIFLEYAGY